MPSWKIHLQIAKKLSKKYNLSDDFIIGNIIPDTTNGISIKNISNVVSHSKTHYKVKKGYYRENDIDKFLDIYKDKLKNEIILGYYIHLLTDNFYNNYTIRHHIKYEKGEKVAILNDNTIEREEIPRRIKQKDFAAFGDYLSYKKLLKGKVNATNKTLKNLQDLENKISEQDLKLIIDSINSKIEETKEKPPKYKMFNEEELKKLFNNCYKYVDKSLKEIIGKEI